MECLSVHRKYLSRHSFILVMVLVLSNSVKSDPDPNPKPQLSFVDTDEDYLALPSDSHPMHMESNGPVTSYAFDNVPLESNPPGAVAVPPPPQFQADDRSGSGSQSAGSQMISIVDHQQQQQQQQEQQSPHQQHHQPSVLQPAPILGQHSQQSSSAALPFYTGFAPEVVAAAGYPYPGVTYPGVSYPGVSYPLAAAAPVVLGHPTTVYVPDQQHAVAVGSEVIHLDGVQHAVGALGWGKEAGFLEIYHHLLSHPHKALEFLFTAAKRLSIPKDHYLNVISFTGIYLFMTYLFYSTEDVLQLTCEVTGGNKKSVPKEWYYHAGRRYVPALPIDKKLQKKFLKLFRGPHLEDEGGSSSSEEDFSGEMQGINELVPKGQFFYSLSPKNIEAWMQLQRLFVLQKSPEEVFSLAKDLLYRQKVHPKIWYLGLMAAAQERPDMTGFTLGHPLDAVPDWFIPAHLIKDEMDRYRSITDEKMGDRAKRIKRDITMIPLVPGRNGTAYVSRSIGHSKTRSKYRSEIDSTFSNVTTTEEPSSSTTEKPIPDSGSAETSGEFVGLDGSIISSGNSGNKLEFSKQKKKMSKGEVNEETVEVNESTLQESMLRHNSNLARQNRNKGKVGSGGVGKNKGKGYGINRNKDKTHDRHKKSHKKKGKGHKGKGKDEEHCIRVDGRVGVDNGIENKLWYWREDLQANQHHWYWHQVYPLNATRQPDRHAELFFFMHRSFLARYNAERLSNGLYRTYELDFQPGGIVHEGYNSHLADLSSGKPWAVRPPKQPLTDIIHLDDPLFSRNFLWPEISETYFRLLKAIKLGKMISANGKYVKISHTNGIEPLTNAIEANDLSINPLYYDYFGIHNTGHLMISYLADPVYKRHLPPGIMADQSMSLRDPAFYPYHTWLDNVFEKYKSKLAPYKLIGGEWPLVWRGVEIHHVEIVSKGHNTHNQLRTFWTDRKFELSPGVDRSVDVADEEQGKICAVHMAHEPFLFKIVLERKPCARSKSGKATIRIFMAPRYDEKGRRFHMKEQRRLMFQLDVFQAKLRAGKNIITRRSHDSSLTKPWSRSLKEMEAAAGQGGAADFCGCGWPQHLYIPKGSPKGLPFDLFVMATNYDEDRVQDSPKDLQFPEPCNSPHIFCGHPRRRYPDARPMGYPFDRPVNKPLLPCHPGHSFGSMICRAFNLVFLKEVETLEQYTSRAPNMKSLTFTIKHIDHFYPSRGHH